MIDKDGNLIFIAFERGICTNCNKDRGPTLKCQGCGWIDPPTYQKSKSEA